MNAQYIINAFPLKRIHRPPLDLCATLQAMKKEIHLIALDIDGTLLNSKGQVSDANLNAVNEVVERGFEVTLVTGRRFFMAEQIASVFEHDLTIVANNGAVIRTSKSHCLFYKNLLPLSAAQQVLRVTQAFRSSCVAHAEDDGPLVCEKIDPENRPLRWYLDKSREEVRQVDSLETFLTVDPVQIMFGGPVATMNGVLNAVAPLVRRGIVRVTKTEYPRRDVSIVDVLSPTCGKAVALEWLLSKQGWTREHLMAIGDNYNDHDMLDLAATAVVMGQGVAEMKTDTRYVTLSNDEDGVAHALQKFVLERSRCAFGKLR